MTQQITKIDKQACKTIRAIIENAVSAELDKHGLKLKQGNMAFNSESVKLNNWCVELKDANTPEYNALLQHNKFLNDANLPTFDCNKIATIGGQDLKLVGYRPRSVKQPFIYQDINTKKMYVASESQVKRMGIGFVQV
tara:strand:+ start:143 stop:556 length:414 start_codon:yes stop_codon:yes gene_type:complete